METLCVKFSIPGGLPVPLYKNLFNSLYGIFFPMKNTGTFLKLLCDVSKLKDNKGKITYVSTCCPSSGADIFFIWRNTIPLTLYNILLTKTSDRITPVPRTKIRPRAPIPSPCLTYSKAAYTFIITASRCTHQLLSLPRHLFWKEVIRFSLPVFRWCTFDSTPSTHSL